MSPDVSGGVADPAFGSVILSGCFSSGFYQTFDPFQISLFALRKLGRSATPVHLLKIDITLEVTIPGCFFKGIPYTLQIGG